VFYMAAGVYQGTVLRACPEPVEGHRYATPTTLSFRPRQEWRNLFFIRECVSPFENREGWGSLIAGGSKGGPARRSLSEFANRTYFPNTQSPR